MKFNFGPRSSILLIFFVHGIIYSVLLLRKGILFSNTSARLLSVFVLLCCLYICPWMLGHAGWYSTQPYRDIMFYIPFQQVLFLGPLIYFYTQSLLNKSFRFSKTDLYHFLPGILYLIYSLIVFVTDKVVLGEYYFYADERDKDLSKWYQITGLISMFTYFVLSLKVYYSYKKLVYQLLSYADSVLFEWMKRFLFAFLMMQIARLVFLFLFPDWGSFPLKWWYYLIFAALFYYIAIVGYSSTEKTVIPLDPSNTTNKENETLSDTVDLEIENLSDTSNPMTSELVELKEKIEQLMLTEKVYRDSQLTLGDLAAKLNTNPRNISQAINRGFDMNFNDYINYHRVEAVKRAMNEEEHTQHTLLAIALDSGFNSKATFNRAFKKHTSFTPKKYLSNPNKPI